jgi:aquaporin Z
MTMKKYIAELFGTAVLVFCGCGAVVAVNLLGTGLTPPASMAVSIHTQGVVAIALAFGLAVTAMAYTIGPVSGCHINPAVTAALWAAGRFETKDVPGMLALVVSGAPGGYKIAGGVFGQNGFGTWSVTSAFLIEVIGTMIFTAVILGVTQAKAGTTIVAGLIIGLTLTLIHIVLIPVTGTSVNPARTLAPNIYAGGQAISQLWVFIVAPLAGGLISGFLFKAKVLSMDE